MKQQLLAVATLVFVSIVPAYAGRNVGFATYAPVDIPDECSKDPAADRCKCVGLKDRYVAPSNLARKASVKKGDYFVVTLKTVWMGQFAPDAWTPFEPRRSQYVLVSRAFQYGDASNQLGFDYSSESHKAGRVIYFNDDVRPGQFLNFGQLIVAGPSEYLGNPVAITLYAIEVDSGGSNSRTNSLIATLAGIGKTAAPAASPVLSVLESIGTALVNANGDDLNLRYDTVTLDYQGLRPGLWASFLAYGDYVLFRKEDREKPLDIRGIHYKPSEAKLYQDNQCQVPWTGSDRGDAYAVIQVNSQEKPSSASSYQTYDQLKKALEAAEVTRTEDLKAASENIVMSITSDRTYTGILDAIKRVEPYIGEKKSPPSTVIGTLKAKLDSLEKIIASYGTDGGNSPKPKTYATMTSNQIDLLIGRLRSDAGERADEISRSGFKATDVYQVIEAAWKP